MTRRIVVVVVLIAALVAVFAFGLTPRMTDFEVYWRGAVRAASAEPLYRAEDNHYQYKYLPAFAVLTIPLGWLSMPAAKAIWNSLSLLLVPALLLLSVKLLPQQRKPSYVLYIVAIVVMGKFFVRELHLGQANLLFAVVAVLGCIALAKGEEFKSGMWAAATVAVKPYGIILMPWLGERGRLRAILGAALGGAVIALLPVAVYGISGTIELHSGWWTTVASTTAPSLSNPDNVSLAALYSRWLGPGQLANVLTILTAAGLVLLAVITALKRRGIVAPEGLEGAMLLMFVPLLSPQGWDYVLLLGTPAVMYLVNYSDELPKILRVVAALAALIIGLSLYDLTGRAAYKQFMDMGVISVCALILISALGTLRMRRIA